MNYVNNKTISEDLFIVFDAYNKLCRLKKYKFVRTPACQELTYANKHKR